MSGLSSQRQAAGIDLLCACLTAGLSSRGPDEKMAGSLFAPAMDLERFAHLAGRHLVTPMLAASLARPDVRDCLPADFVRYLTLMHEQNRLRNLNLRRQLQEIAAALDPIGIEPLLLKGGIRLVDGLYPCIGWRFMRDLDILVARERLPDAAACLQRQGYRFTAEEDWPEQHRHLPPLYRDGDGAVIELHADLLTQHRRLCPEDLLARARPIDLDGVTVRIPDTADQLAHLIGHDLTDGFLRHSSMLQLRSVFETSLLCRDKAAVRTVLARSDNSDAATGIRVALGLAARFFPNQGKRLSGDRLGVRLRIRRLNTMERFDDNGRFRRFLWFSRLRFSKLLKHSAERRHLAVHLLSPDYHRRCVRRIRRLWASE